MIEETEWNQIKMNHDKRIETRAVIRCASDNCKAILSESEYELHHLVPRCIGGVDMDGRIYVCKKHHHIIGNALPKYIWKFVPENRREECKEYIKKQTQMLMKIL